MSGKKDNPPAVSTRLPPPRPMGDFRLIVQTGQGCPASGTAWVFPRGSPQKPAFAPTEDPSLR